MRFVLIASAIFAASVSTASAQSAPTPAAQPSAPAAPAQQAAAPTPAQQWSMDHGHAEDAANSAKAAAAAAATASPGPSTNFVVNGSATIAAEPPRTPEQQKADAQAQSAWQARCRPTVMVDREGLRRTRYAESDCDLSRYNTAGR